MIVHKTKDEGFARLGNQIPTQAMVVAKASSFGINIGIGIPGIPIFQSPRDSTCGEKTIKPLPRNTFVHAM